VAASVLDELFDAVLGAILDLRQVGHSEGVGYDGYIMDFVVHWLQAMDARDRKPILDHSRFGDLLDESVALGAPGDVANVAEIGDVEPKEMPYHLAAHAKLYVLTQDARAAWLLGKCRRDWMRADALGVLHGVVDGWAVDAPKAGALDGHYTTVLRSGWEGEDCAVAMSVSNSPMGHLQKDTGTLLIGSRGKWLIDDPGYQQYMKKTEREFTLGVGAHNAPVINGQAQVNKLSARHVRRDTLAGDVCRMDVDLTACYANDLALDVVKRTVWLRGNDLVVVADYLVGQQIDRLNYYWHGHPDAAWWVADGWAQVYFPDVTLWVSSPQAKLSDAQVDRLPGSRGQLTLCAEVDWNASVIWWVFQIGEKAPSVVASGDGLDVNGQSFTL
ncbi:MAG: heparinase II/III domain-containing protein, partial [Candidatus Latescibacterota bacterium]